MVRSNLPVRLGRFLAAGLLGGLLTACASPAAGPATSATAAPEAQVATDKPDNRVAVTRDANRLIVDVVSPSGIGSAGVRLPAGDMPPTVLMRFHLRGLEQMTLAFGDAVVKLSAPSGGRPVLQSVIEAGQERAIGPDSSYWMEVTQTAPPDGSDSALFEVTSPPAFAASPPASFTVGWIDFYR